MTQGGAREVFFCRARREMLRGSRRNWLELSEKAPIARIPKSMRRAPAGPSICISRLFPFLYQRLALPSRTRFPPELARARAISLLSVSRQVRSSLLLSSMISRSLLDTDSIEQELYRGIISLEDNCTIRFMATHLHDVTVCCRSRLDIWLGRDRQAFFFLIMFLWASRGAENSICPDAVQIPVRRRR
jgi:hypothetical protein